jgi:hypothetical protein
MFSDAANQMTPSLLLATSQQHRIVSVCHNHESGRMLRLRTTCFLPMFHWWTDRDSDGDPQGILSHPLGNGNMMKHLHWYSTSSP